MRTKKTKKTGDARIQGGCSQASDNNPPPETIHPRTHPRTHAHAVPDTHTAPTFHCKPSAGPGPHESFRCPKLAAPSQHSVDLHQPLLDTLAWKKRDPRSRRRRSSILDTTGTSGVSGARISGVFCVQTRTAGAAASMNSTSTFRNEGVENF